MPIKNHQKAPPRSQCGCLVQPKTSLDGLIAMNSFGFLTYVIVIREQGSLQKTATIPLFLDLDTIEKVITTGYYMPTLIVSCLYCQQVCVSELIKKITQYVCTHLDISSFRLYTKLLTMLYSACHFLVFKAPIESFDFPYGGQSNMNYEKGWPLLARHWSRSKLCCYAFGKERSSFCSRKEGASNWLSLHTWRQRQKKQTENRVRFSLIISNPSRLTENTMLQ